ncbi:TPA: hypothetical protein N0F65_008217 [Lagenidium giganteum]|uniref:26S proteasome non-ATPase regulatory subunit 10 n=1 Tax=Lagenidium giganteum TaxID=4803 RepID=A0AAV2Z0Q8_9STRA|nr:TPA: hypothetical protein N0F65_008217 [Lagenidium giganteum]
MTTIIPQKAREMTALHAAVAANDVAQVKQLLEQGGVAVNAKDEDERTPLHWSAAAGKIDLVELLVTAGHADVNTQGDSGWTPLMSAVSAGHRDVVGFLLSKGANANIANENGQLPLHYHKGRLEVAEILVDYTNDINHADNTGSTALMRAIGAKPSRDVLVLLMDHGAKLDARDNAGNTALHLALMEGHEDIALFLVDTGANPNAKNADKQRCIDLASPVLRSQIQAMKEKRELRP